jgi:hypothetical protein
MKAMHNHARQLLEAALALPTLGRTCSTLPPNTHRRVPKASACDGPLLPLLRTGFRGGLEGLRGLPAPLDHVRQQVVGLDVHRHALVSS